jgi:hypothetical protein
MGNAAGNEAGAERGGVAHGSAIHPRADENPIPPDQGEVRWGVV